MDTWVGSMNNLNPNPVNGYKSEALNAILAELKTLIAAQSRIGMLQRSAMALGELCGVDVRHEHPDLFWKENVGIIDTMRHVFRTSDKSFTPVEVRSAMKEMGFEFGGYTNFMATIHSNLKRLIEQGQVERLDPKHYRRRR